MCCQDMFFFVCNLTAPSPLQTSVVMFHYSLPGLVRPHLCPWVHLNEAVGVGVWGGDGGEEGVGRRGMAQGKEGGKGVKRAEKGRVRK